MAHADLESRLREFDEVDKCPYSFRYPVDTKGEASVPDTFALSMDLFCENADALLDALETVVFGLEAQLDQQDGLEAEMMGYYSAGM